MTWPMVLGLVACVSPYALPRVRKSLARSRPIRSVASRLSVGPSVELRNMFTGGGGVSFVRGGWGWAYRGLLLWFG